LITLLATTLPPFGFAFFNSMFALFVAWFFSFTTYLYLSNDPLKNENKDFLDFYFLHGFPTRFFSIISKASTFCGTKVLTQKESNFVDHVFQMVKLLEIFFIKYFNNLKEDPMIESRK
jgi:hypothetical protein